MIVGSGALVVAIACVMSWCKSSSDSAPVASPSAENLARRAHASASESQDDLKPERAIDGDVASRWSGIPGHNSGVWFELAWDAPVDISCVLLRQYDRYVHELDLETFDETTNAWTRLAHFGSAGKRLPLVVLWRGTTTNAAVHSKRLRIANITNGPSFTEVEVYSDPFAYEPTIELASDLRGDFLGVVTDPFGASPIADADVTIACETPLGPNAQRIRTDANGQFRAAMPVGMRGSVVATVSEQRGAPPRTWSRTFDAAQFFRSLTPVEIDARRAGRWKTVEANELDLRSDARAWSVCADPPEGFWKKEFDDTSASTSSWQPLQHFPSHFAMEGVNSLAGVFGVRLRFRCDPKAGMRRKLRFDSVYSGCEVWLDGELVALHEGMTPFEVDVTDVLDRGGDHLLALRVREHTRTSDELDRMSQYADFPLAGIMRKVTLFEVPVVHVERLETTTDLDAACRDAVVRVKISVCNESSEVVDAGELGLELRDDVRTDAAKAAAAVTAPAIASTSTRFTLAPWSSAELALDLPVAAPRKWDSEHPNLYTLAVTTRANRSVRQFRESIGFRKVEVVGPQILVNGRPVKFRGTCHHDSDPVLGRAVTVERELQDLDLIRRANLNALRTSHYPPLPELLVGADERGLFVEDEAPFCWVGASDDLRLAPKILELTSALLARDRNHPCVFMWSLCNESEFGRGFERSHELVRAVDPTRPTGAATSAWLEIATHHNPITLGRIDENERLEQPLFFDESLCVWQGIWNDAGELLVDPGIRDAWVVPLIPIWKRLLESRATQGSFIWCFADDLFLVPGRGLEYGRNHTRSHFVEECYAVPGRGIVGDAPWGFVDGWRREKPEFEHVRRLHSPVWIEEKPIAAERGKDGGVTLRVPVENRFDFTDLGELRFGWSFDVRRAPDHDEGTVAIAAPPHSRAELVVTSKRSPQRGDLLRIRADDPRGIEYEFAIPIDAEPENAPDLTSSSTSPSTPGAPPPPLELANEDSLAGSAIRVVGRDFELAFDRGSAQLRRGVVSGSPLLLDLPAPHLLVSGAPFDPIPADDSWRGKSLRVDQRGDAGDVVVHVDGAYRDLEGGLDWTIRADGSNTLHVAYKYAGPEVVAREVGVSFSLARDCELLQWSRRAEWRDLPSNHVGRASGTAWADASARDASSAGSASSDLPPSLQRLHDWSSDPSPLGSSDFRSTKRNVNWAFVGRRSPGPGLLVVDRADATGAHARPLDVRAMVDHDRVRFHVNTFSGGSAAGLWEWESNYGRGRTLKPGDAIDVTLELAFVSAGRSP